MRKLQARHGLILLSSLAIACVGILVYITYQNMRETARINESNSGHLATIFLTGSIEANLNELENNQRGFIFTSKDSFRIPFNQSLEIFESDLVRIPQLQSSQALKSALRKQIVQRLHIARQMTQYFEESGIFKVLPFMQRGDLRKADFAIRESLHSIHQSSRQSIETANNRLTQLATKTTHDFFYLACGFILILLFFLYLINLDLIHRQRTEKKLSLQASLLQAMTEAIITTSPNLLITGWNRFAEQMYGYTESEAIGKSIDNLLQLKIDPKEAAVSFRELNLHGHHRGEYQAFRKDGAEVFMLASISVVRSSSGAISSYVAVHKDITARVLLDRELYRMNQELEFQVREKTEEVQRMVERISDVFIALDNQWNLTFVNKRSYEILKLPDAYLQGKNLWDVFPQYKDKPFNQIGNEALATQEYRFHQTYIDILDRWVDIHIYPSSTGLSVYFQDITERKKAEEEIRLSEQKLQQSNAEIRQLAAHLQHIREEERARIAREIHDELGQQLTGLKMYIASLRKKMQDLCALEHGPDKEELKKIIDGRFTATFELVEATIHSVRKISTELRPSMLDDLGLIAAMEWLCSEFEKRFSIPAEFIHPLETPNIQEQVKTGLFRIFQESLTNIARHSAATKVTASLNFYQSAVFLEIMDNGTGFEPAEVSGLQSFGLVGMKERALAMGGQFEIHSVPGSGTTIRIAVPLSAEWNA